MPRTGTPAAFRRLLAILGGAFVLIGCALAWLPPARLGLILLPVSCLVFGLALYVASRLPGKWSARLGLSFVSFLILLGALEIVFALQSGPSPFDTVYQLDETCHYRLAPHSSRIYQHSPLNGGRSIAIRVDSDGYRGGELSELHGDVRLAVTGDSFVAAEFSEEADTFVARLAHHAGEATGLRVDAVNVGVPGYGPDQSLARLESDLATLRPDVVVFCVYSGNDYGDLIRNQLFRIGDDGALVRNEPQLSEELRREFWVARHEPVVVKMLERAALRAWGIIDWRFRHWFGAGNDADGASDELSGFLDQCMDQVTEQYRRHVEQGDVVARALLGDPYDADCAMLPNGPSATYKRRLMELVLERVRDVSATSGVPMMLVVIPSPIDTCDRHQLGTVDVTRFPDYRRTNLTAPLVEMAVRLGIPCANLFDLFRAHPNGELSLKGNENHWNEQGQDVSAQDVARALVDAGLLKPLRREGSGQGR